MKLGTIVKYQGKIGTIVYHGLDGHGIKWGRHFPNPADFVGVDFMSGAPDGWQWYPDIIVKEDDDYHIVSTPEAPHD